MSRYSTKVPKNNSPVSAPKDICWGCGEICFLTSCKDSCSTLCKGTASTRPRMKKTAEK